MHRIQLAEQVRREQESRREVQEEVKNWERIGARLHGEVQDLHLQLKQRVQKLQNAKDELQQHQDQIEVRSSLRFSDLVVISWLWEGECYFNPVFATGSYTVKMIIIK